VRRSSSCDGSCPRRAAGSSSTVPASSGSTAPRSACSQEPLARWRPRACRRCFAFLTERFPSAADAVERCEDVLIADACLPGGVEDIPLAGNDLCQPLSAIDLGVLASALETRRYQPGLLIGPEPPGPGEALMFITRGRVAIEQVQAASDSAGPPVSLRIAARSAGTAVGSLAILTPDTAPTRLRAETEVEVLVLTETALDRLTDDHPAVAAALLHATTQAIAAEYRWLAAENLALSR